MKAYLQPRNLPNSISPETLKPQRQFVSSRMSGIRIDLLDPLVIDNMRAVIRINGRRDQLHL